MAKSKTDAQMIACLKREASEVLEGEVDFDALVERVVAINPSGVSLGRYKRRRAVTKSNSKSTKNR
jgi:hypothetical protein